MFESSGEKNFPLIIPFGTFASGTSDDLPGKKCRYPLSVFAGSLIYIGRQFPLDETTFAGMLQNHPQKCIVIADIHKKGIHARLWHQWLEKATVSVDMMWYGILFFDDKIQEGRYCLMI